jgi:hypothetical protein
MQIFILLLPPFSIIFHVPGSAGGDVVAVGSEIGSAGKGICACGRRIPDGRCRCHQEGPRDSLA